MGWLGWLRWLLGWLSWWVCGSVELKGMDLRSCVGLSKLKGMDLNGCLWLGSGFGYESQWFGYGGLVVTMVCIFMVVCGLVGTEILLKFLGLCCVNDVVVVTVDLWVVVVRYWWWLVLWGVFFFCFLSSNSIVFQWWWWWRWLAFGGWAEFQWEVVAGYGFDGEREKSELLSILYYYLRVVYIILKMCM